jgi:hypothetical protein
MPRVIPPENLGCPPFRALTFDSLGLIKGAHFALSVFNIEVSFFLIDYFNFDVQ